MLARAAIETHAIGLFLIGERAAQFLVPATENFAHDSDFFTKGLIRALRERRGRSVSFQFQFHYSIPSTLLFSRPLGPAWFLDAGRECFCTLFDDNS